MTRLIASSSLLRFWVIMLALLTLTLFGGFQLAASSGEKPVKRDYSAVFAAPSPETQTKEEAAVKSAGCISCHTASDAWTMHRTEAVVLGCTDCHGGNASVRLTTPLLDFKDPAYVALRDKAHVLPRYPEGWHWPSSANPKRSFTLLNKESPEFIRFMNPGDLRVARLACGSCHLPIVQASERSLMATSAMLWGGAAYNNGILPFKRPVLGEAYTADGTPAMIRNPITPDAEMTAKGILPFLAAMVVLLAILMIVPDLALA